MVHKGFPGDLLFEVVSHQLVDVTLFSFIFILDVLDTVNIHTLIGPSEPGLHALSTLIKKNAVDFPPGRDAIIPTSCGLHDLLLGHVSRGVCVGTLLGPSAFLLRFWGRLCVARVGHHCFLITYIFPGSNGRIYPYTPAASYPHSGRSRVPSTNIYTTYGTGLVKYRRRPAHKLTSLHGGSTEINEN